MTTLTDRQIQTLRALLAGRTVTPDRAGLVEAWALAGDWWARESKSAAVRRGWGVSHSNGPQPRLMTALAAMKHDMPAWTETVRRLIEKELRQ